MRPFASPLCAAAVAATLLGAGACAHNSDALAQDVNRLQTELNRLRAETIALGDRLEALEVAAGPDERGPGEPPETRGNAAAPAERPTLAVVRLGPAEAEPAPPPEEEPASDDEGRPLLKGDAKGASIEVGGKPEATATKAPKGGAKP